MKAQKLITVTINEDGSSDIDLEGFEGKGCSEVIADFQAGDDVKISRTKPEYHGPVKKTLVQKQGVR